MAESENLMVKNRSTLKEFIASVATMTGDLSNITAPPFVLDTKSTVELPQYWADHPSIFCAPAQSSDPAERAMLVLRWYLSSLRNQNYMGRGENDGIKKPLNAFLGELFLGKFDGGEGIGETKLVGEQVSHHPPITACHVWNDTHGVIASGYTRQTITFNGNVTVQQTGHALFTLKKHSNESYLIPLPTLKVRGILSGSPYPELGGKYYIPSTSGYMSVIEFSGKGWFGTSKKNTFDAKVYKEDEGEHSEPIYTVHGQWNGEFVVHDVRKDQDVEVVNVSQQSKTASKLEVDPIENQDPWETRRAWQDVIESLNNGDMAGTSRAKTVVEQGQRNMRKDDQREGREWTRTFFKCVDHHEIAQKLERKVPGASESVLQKENKDTMGFWVFEEERYQAGQIQQPYHGDLVPDNSQSARRYSVDSQQSNSGVYGRERRTSSSNSPRSSVASIYSESSSRRSSQELGSRPQSRSGSLHSKTASMSPSPLGAGQEKRKSASSLAPRDSGVSDMSSLRSSLEVISKVPKDQPAPQAEQALQKEKHVTGSGIPDMGVEEKMEVEDFLRSQYKTGVHRHKKR